MKMILKSILSIEDARKFLGDPGSVQLSLFEYIDEAAAKIISGGKTEWLCLDGLIELTEEVARELITFEGRGLSLNALTKITDPVAEVLSNFTGELQLNGLKQISNHSATALGKHRGTLYLDGLTIFSVGAAEALVGHPNLHLCVATELSKHLPKEAAVLFESAAKHAGRTCYSEIGHLRYVHRGWPPPMPRRTYYITNDDPTKWTLTSAVFQAMDGRENVSQLQDGWFFTMSVEEIEGFTVLLEDSLTLPEREVVIASGTWPLLRIPDGLLLIGPVPGRSADFGISEDDRFEVRVGYHDRYAIVRVPPGCYSVGIHQHWSSEYTFELKNLDISCDWDPAVESRKTETLPTCPEYLPLILRDDLTPNARRIDPSESNVGSFEGLRNNPEGMFSLQFSKRLRWFPRAPIFHVDLMTDGWTERLP